LKKKKRTLPSGCNPRKKRNPPPLPKKKSELRKTKEEKDHTGAAKAYPENYGAPSPECKGGKRRFPEGSELRWPQKKGNCFILIGSRRKGKVELGGDKSILTISQRGPSQRKGGKGGLLGGKRGTKVEKGIFSFPPNAGGGPWQYRKREKGASQRFEEKHRKKHLSACEGEGKKKQGRKPKGPN